MRRRRGTIRIAPSCDRCPKCGAMRPIEIVADSSWTTYRCHRCSWEWTAPTAALLARWARGGAEENRDA